MQGHRCWSTRVVYRGCRDVDINNYIRLCHTWDIDVMNVQRYHKEALSVLQYWYWHWWWFKWLMLSFAYTLGLKETSNPGELKYFSQTALETMNNAKPKLKIRFALFGGKFRTACTSIAWFRHTIQCSVVLCKDAIHVFQWSTCTKHLGVSSILESSEDECRSHRIIALDSGIEDQTFKYGLQFIYTGRKQHLPDEQNGPIPKRYCFVHRYYTPALYNFVYSYYIRPLYIFVYKYCTPPPYSFVERYYIAPLYIRTTLYFYRNWIRWI